MRYAPKPKPFNGKVRIVPSSSLRKLMRAARRGVIPDERAVIIHMAAGRASQRADAYLNSSPAKRAYVSKMDAKRRAVKP